MSHINWISSTIGLLTAGLIFYLVRRDHLHTRYALWWVPVALIMAILGVFPQLVDRIATILGISYPPVFPLLLGLVAMVVKILVMDIERSRNEVNLTQQVKNVQGRAVYQSGKFWVDSELQNQKAKNQKRIQFNSDEYFKLLNDKPETSQFFALGQNVRFYYDNTFYEIYE